MRDTVAFIVLIAFLVTFWAIIKPYKGFARKHFGWLSLVLFVCFIVAVPPLSPEQVAAAKAEADGKAAAELQKQSGDIASKTDEALKGIIEYTRAANPKTYALLGSRAFAQLNELEPGAFYAAAESKHCDSVASGAVSISASAKGAPKWFVDCANGNRFIITAEQAASALKRKANATLALSDLGESCTTSSVAMCSASDFQKTAKETEIVSLCDMTVNEALISESDMDWGWNYAFGEGDEVEVVRSFTAQNAFGAELKHRYVCHFDAKSKRITKLTIEGPMGSQRII